MISKIKKRVQKLVWIQLSLQSFLLWIILIFLWTTQINNTSIDSNKVRYDQSIRDGIFNLKRNYYDHSKSLLDKLQNNSKIHNIITDKSKFPKKLLNLIPETPTKKDHVKSFEFSPKKYGKPCKNIKDKAFHDLTSPRNIQYLWKSRSVLDFGKQLARDNKEVHKTVQHNDEMRVSIYDKNQKQLFYVSLAYIKLNIYYWNNRKVRLLQNSTSHSISSRETTLMQLRGKSGDLNTKLSLTNSQDSLDISICNYWINSMEENMELSNISFAFLDSKRNPNCNLIIASDQVCTFIIRQDLELKEHKDIIYWYKKEIDRLKERVRTLEELLEQK